jgi:hypothetical protein
VPQARFGHGKYSLSRMNPFWAFDWGGLKKASRIKPTKYSFFISVVFTRDKRCSYLKERIRRLFIICREALSK